MKVLINGLQISKEDSGVQYYTRNLFDAIDKVAEPDMRCYLQISRDTYRQEMPGQFLECSETIQHRMHRILFENIRLPRMLKTKGYDLFHSPNYVLPALIRTPSVVTIHDLITLDYPGLCQNESVLYFRCFLPNTIRKARRIIAVSQTVKQDILNHFKIPEHKIVVVHLGIKSIFQPKSDISVLKKYNLPDKYLLFVGNIEPKKNLVRLIKAFSILKQKYKIDYKLVLAGKLGWKYKAVFKTIQTLNLQNDVIFTGYVDEEDLPALYSMASIFIFPSLYEGFGIPPLEAMACEVPVITSNAGALPEITGGNCVMVDPYNTQEMATRIYQFLQNDQQQKDYVLRAKRWVQQYSWDTVAQKTIEVYKQVLNESITN